MNCLTSFSAPSPHPPMPRIVPALTYVTHAQGACARGANCNNEAALRDAIRSARYFLDMAEESLPGPKRGNGKKASDA